MSKIFEVDGGAVETEDPVDRRGRRARFPLASVLVRGLLPVQVTGEGDGGVKRVYKSFDVTQPRLGTLQYLPTRLDCGPFSAFSFSTRNRSCLAHSIRGTTAYVAAVLASLSHSILPAPPDSTNATAFDRILVTIGQSPTKAQSAAVS